jgi:hypothetical protein
MADDTVRVRFGAETSGVASGAGAVKGLLTGIQAIVADLAAAFKALAGAATAGFSEMVAGAKEASGSLKEMRDTATEVRESFRAVSEALIAAFVIEQLADFAEKMAGTAEQTQHVAQTFGITTNAVQALRAEAAGLGVPFETFVTTMQRSDRALTTAREGSARMAQAFRVLGINIHEPIDQATLLQREIAGLAAISDVPSRIGLAMQIFGRDIASIGPIIGATKEQIAAISAATNQYGAVNSGAQAAGMELAEAFNMQHIAVQGLGNTLTAELAPGLAELVKNITAMIESFREWAGTGDNLKNALTGMGVAAAALASILGAGALSAAIEGLAGLLGGVFLGAIEVATAGMVTFDAAADANPIGAIVLAVEALIAGLVLLYNWLNKTGEMTVIVNSLAAAWETVQAAAKLVSDAFAAAWETVQAAAKLVSDALEPVVNLSLHIMGSGINAYLGVMRGLWDGIAGAVQTLLGPLVQAVQMLGQIMALGFGAELADWKARFDALIGATHDFLEAHFPDVMKTWDGWVKTLKGDVDSLVASFENFLGIAGSAPKPPGAPPRAGAPPKPAAAPAGAIPDLATPKKGKAGESQVGQWTEQLHDQELKAAAATGDYMKDQTDLEIAFWQQKLAATTVGSKTWYEVQDKLFPLLKQKATDGFNALVEGDKAAIDKDRGNAVQWAADWAKYVSDVTKAFGAGTAQAIRAAKESADAFVAEGKRVADVTVKATQDQVKAATDGIKAHLEIAKIGMNERLGIVEAEAKSGAISKGAAYRQKLQIIGQENTATTDAANQQYRTTVEGLERQANAYLNSGQVEKAAEVLEQIRALNIEHGQQMDVLAAQQAQAYVQAWQQRLQQLQQQFHSYLDPVVSSFGSAMTKMAEGTMTLRQAIAQVGESMIQVFVSAVEKMVENWIVNLFLGQTAQKTTAMSQVASYAGVAGAAGVASFAGAPWPIDMGAPDFGQAMAAAAMSFAGLASAAGGFDIPAGVNPLTQLHAQEMVLPASIANPVRAMAAGYDDGKPWWGDRGGDTFNINHSPTYNGPSDGQTSPRELRKSIEKMQRRGVFKRK